MDFDVFVQKIYNEEEFLKLKNYMHINYPHFFPH